MEPKVSIEKLMLMHILGCDINKLEIIFKLFKRFEDTYRRSIVAQIIQELDSEYVANDIISGILLEILEIINSKYNIDIDFLSLQHTDIGYKFDREYLEQYLKFQDIDAEIQKEIVKELQSWSVIYSNSLLN